MLLDPSVTATKVRRMLSGTDRQAARNRLAAPVTHPAASVALGDWNGNPGVGSLLEVGDHLYRIFGVAPATKALTVVSEVPGTDVSTPAGVVTLLDPLFSHHELVSHVLDELASWPDSIYWPSTLAPAAPTTVRGPSCSRGPTSGYIAGTVVLVGTDPGPVRVNRLCKVVGRGSDGTMPGVKAELVSFTHTDVDTYEYYLWLPSWYGSVQVTFGFDFGWLKAGDGTTMVGFPDSLEDVVRIGATLRAIQTRDIPAADRTFQGESRETDDVPIGSMSAMARELERLRTRRLREEAHRLLAQYPSRF